MEGLLCSSREAAVSQCAGFRCRSLLAAVCAFTLGLCGVGAFVYNLGYLGEALPVAWLFLSLKVSGVDFLDFGPVHTGIGAPASWERSVPLSAVNSTSALLSASERCIALNLLLLFISHTVVVLPLPHGGSGPSII